jgi:hypothetical protein
MFGEKTIQQLDEQLERNLKKELRDQGHYLTGRLEASIAPKFISGPNGATLEIHALDYINELETGIPPEHIDVNDIKYIQGLTEYAKKRFHISSDRQATRVALRIAAKHRQEGMPTQASYQYSSTGERTEAIQTSYDEHAKENEQLIEDGWSKELDQLIDETFDQTIF